MAVAVYGTRTRGAVAPEVFHEAAMRKLASDRSLLYEAHEFLIATPSTNVSIRTVVNHATSCSCARATGFLGIMARAQRVSIRNIGAGSVTVKFNDAALDPITIEDGEKFDWDFTEATDIFFTNVGGSAVAVRVLLG